jgi:hypothetical protein
LEARSRRARRVEIAAHDIRAFDVQPAALRDALDRFETPFDAGRNGPTLPGRFRCGKFTAMTGEHSVAP